jgi:hypothetical protein
LHSPPHSSKIHDVSKDALLYNGGLERPKRLMMTGSLLRSQIRLIPISGQ